MAAFAETLATRGRASNKRFELCNTDWGKFEDGTDNITLGYTKKDEDGNSLSIIDSPTYFKGKDLLFIASFHSNDVTMSQFHVLAHLCESFAKSLTVLLPFYSTATMERVDINHDGVVPTASTLARFFNGLPSMGYPIRLMTYDLHTLQNRFYVTGHAVASLHTATSLIRKKISELGIDTLAFPDAGARKRFSSLFKEIARDRVITCEKVRIGDKRLISVIDGSELLRIKSGSNPSPSEHILLVDDMIKSGGTLIQCAEKLKTINEKEGTGKIKISIYATHAVFEKKFFEHVNNGKFKDIKIHTTNSIPNNITVNSRQSKTITDITMPRQTGNDAHIPNHCLDNVTIEVLDLTQQVLEDL